MTVSNCLSFKPSVSSGELTAPLYLKGALKSAFPPLRYKKAFKIA